ncbi:MAG: methyltransferase type 11 [Ruminococcus sp.]|uniref:methyltransferase type 11 n=1 Tax=Ruminococcus sp. TaxID=41978 RepID=UPI0025D1FB92|nr:methyltransferase type 11 [Ruminococcus sp.]MCR4794442.1 methyltransferase type 11 [Ruminococcus sp.]
MSNPWEEISLDDYEKHMSLESVRQLQALDSIMQEQFNSYPAETAMVLGIAGGNGLEHVSSDKFRKVYGVDINLDYLRAVSLRYTELSGVLECLHIDLVNEVKKLPQTQLLIANLLIEYIGYGAFQKSVLQTAPEYVSCVIQINTDEEQWVSESPYLHAFDRLDEVHHQMEEKALTAAMDEIGYSLILQETYPLPNGKALVRVDFARNEEILI